MLLPKGSEDVGEFRDSGGSVDSWRVVHGEGEEEEGSTSMWMTQIRLKLTR